MREYKVDINVIITNFLENVDWKIFQTMLNFLRGSMFGY